MQVGQGISASRIPDLRVNQDSDEGDGRKPETSMVPFAAANSKYESWLRTQCNVVETALDLKHCRMRESPFMFLRATFFRWAGEIENVLPELSGAPSVLSVGDAHVQNFGIWKDKEGRLVWGVNDFDDAAIIPYPFDIVRLATSATLSKRTGLGRRDICDKIIEGYLLGVGSPMPIVLDEKKWWLRNQVRASKSKALRFWREIDGLSVADPKQDVKDCLSRALPKECEQIQFRSRIAGGGSLGRPRYVVVGQWNGGRIVREAKALVTSGWEWSHGRNTSINYLQFANGRSRSPDPNLSECGGFLLRRLSPESRKIELGQDDNIEMGRRLLRAMGQEIGSIQGEDRSIAKLIVEHIKEAKGEWLHGAVKRAENFVRNDFRDYMRSTLAR